MGRQAVKGQRRRRTARIEMENVVDRYGPVSLEKTDSAWASLFLFFQLARWPNAETCLLPVFSFFFLCLLHIVYGGCSPSGVSSEVGTWEFIWACLVQSEKF